MKKALIILSILLAQTSIAATVTEVTLKTPSGDVETFRSDDEDILEQRPPFKALTLSPNNWYCKKSKAYSVLSRQVEKKMELDFLVRSLVNRKRLTANQRKEILRTPDCKDFRFNLHIVAMIEEQGYRLKKVNEYEE